MSQHPLRQRVGRELVKAGLDVLLRWKPMMTAEAGYSIVLGVPWDLRHLLAVNLQFVARTELKDLRRVHVVFDRCYRREMREIEEQTLRSFPQLPIVFHHYPAVAGSIVERVNVSTFYNSMNTTLALAECTTRYAVLHDFDLYPLRPDHFSAIVAAMRDHEWRFSGHELTHFDGLVDSDGQIGTWTLGIDVEWLRSRYRPIHCFHRVTTHRGRRFNLDPFAWIQFQTADRGLTEGFGDVSFCHVKNLCSTYLRFLKRAPLKVAWRLHYLWYLEEISGKPGRVPQVVTAMDSALGPILEVDQLPADFSTVHVTSSNVLRAELERMEVFLFGAVRPAVAAYLASFERFLRRHGDSQTLRREDGSVIWEATEQADRRAAE
jgi:hypothetical protein